MAPTLITRFAFAAFFSSNVYAYAGGQCESFGIDFQEGGHYFQNNASSDPFTALQQFQGCTNDTSNNVLVDPEGNQSQCSLTEMEPSDKPQLVTCSDSPKDSLYSGNWSLLIISNNGDAAPLAAQRDFYLDVGPQTTVTVTPSGTASGHSTVISTGAPTTSTITVTSTVPATTKTVGSQPQGPHGWTHRPHPSIVKTTQCEKTYTLTKTTFTVSATVKTINAACTAPAASPYHDKPCEIKPTILGPLNEIAAQVIEGVQKTVEGATQGLHLHHRELHAAAAFKRAIIEGREPSAKEKRAFIAVRNARLAHMNIDKRAPDNRTVTVTATSVGSPITLPLGSAPTTITTHQTSYTTVTKTVSSGTAYASEGGKVGTTTAPVPTWTWTAYQPWTVTYTTTTKTIPVTNTVTTTAHGAAATCARKGMYLH